MLNYPIIYKALGVLLYLEALLLGVCYASGFVLGEPCHLTFGVPALTALLLGMGFHYVGRNAENRLGRRDGFLIVSLTWVVYSLVGMMPFLLGGGETRVAAAFFETMSGLTTTGATALRDLDALPRPLLLWRSMTHWIGGMGIVFFTIAILPNIGSGDLKLFSAEATGLKTGKLHPRISTTARWLWSLYLLLTLACATALYLGGMNAFDAVNHGLSTVATGGFSTHTASLAFFSSPCLEWIETVFMLLASVNFTLLYLVFVKGRVRDALRDGELRCLLLLFFAAAVSAALIMHYVDGADWETALRAACFNTASLQSTTGLTCEDFMSWHPTVWLILTLVSVIGGCAGSTSGGIKCIRALMAFKITRSEFRQMLHPHAVLPVRINGTLVTPQMGRTLLVFFLLYAALAAVSAFAMVAMGVPLLDSVGLAVSSLSNIGPSIGHIVGPLASWDCLSDAALWLNSFLMLAGRLEIFSLLLPFTAAFWRDE